MTKTHAKLLLASKNAATGIWLYTWELTFPRCILAEVNTHRMASRNTASSRAIPSKKLRRTTIHDPFIPISVGAQQKGMQAGEEIQGMRRTSILFVWSVFRYFAVFQNWLLEKLGAPKQIANRVLEPWMWCVQVFSATDVKNLFLLRNHRMAEPHFHELARQMQAQVDYVTDEGEQYTKQQKFDYQLALDICKIQILRYGKWHLPYIRATEEELSIEQKQQLSIARCAQTSYTIPGEGQQADIVKATSICDKLFGSQPMHLSPTEHVALALVNIAYAGNFKGWMQYRLTIPGQDGGEHVAYPVT